MAVYLLSIALFANTVMSDTVNKFGSRIEIEKQAFELEKQFKPRRKNISERRLYANVLYKLGDMNKSYEMHGQFVEINDDPKDLLLGAKTALALFHLPQAEKLFKSLYTNGIFQEQAAKGLALTYYQQQTFDQTQRLDPSKLPGELKPFVEYLSQISGQPYTIIWENKNKIARVKFENDIHAPAALPELFVTVNGIEMLLTLDTGGDRLYLDETPAQKAKIQILAESKSKYAYTKGKVVKEPLGIADTVELGDVVLHNVPVTIAQWKANGPITDGVLGTAVLKQFLTTLDYKNSEIVFRPRGTKQAIKIVSQGRQMRSLPFFLASTHLMITKGQLNERKGLNFFVDSGLAATMPLVMVEETIELLDLKKNAIPDQPYYWVSINEHGLTGMLAGSTQALGNVFVDDDMYSKQGFLLDVLISHQYLRAFGDWTIDFDAMQFYFPQTSR